MLEFNKVFIEKKNQKTKHADILLSFLHIFAVHIYSKLIRV